MSNTTDILTDEQMEENVNAQFALKEVEYIGDELDDAEVIMHKARGQSDGILNIQSECSVGVMRATKVSS